MNFKSEIIYFEQEGILKLNNYIKKTIPTKVVFLVDEITYKLCYPQIINEVEIHVPIKIIKITPGEKNKNLETCDKIWSDLAKIEADRSTLMINLGGGVVTDIGSFTASTYMRGIKFINIPTTLLAMADASIGGKTGIDLNILKNLVGTFSCPEMVLIYSKFLNTLDTIQLKSGFAEIIKHSLIADKNQWNIIKNIDYKSINQLKNILPDTIRIKSKIVKLDFKEKNIRKTLNFGHTIGHAIESYFLYLNKPILHGEAVAMGILAESFISHKMNFLTIKNFLDIEKYLLNIYTIYEISKIDFKFLFSVMQKDKKNKSSKLQFSLINSIGNGIFNQEIIKEKIIESLFYLMHLKK